MVSMPPIDQTACAVRTLLGYAAVIALSLLLTATRAAAPEPGAPEAAADMARAATKFLETLSAVQRAQTTFAFEHDERLNWHFFPRARKGVALGALQSAQTGAAQALLRSALSAPGYAKTFNVIELERLLQARSSLYDPGAYHFSVFGTPGAKLWGWRFEGHHLSLNFTIAGERFIATTPSFFGANPAQVGAGANKGLRTLKDEEDIARALLLSLSEQQRAAAIVDTRSYAQIVSGTAPKVAALPAAGVSGADLDAKQSALLTQLLAAHANTLRPELAQQRLARIETAGGIGKVRFAWSGGTQRGEAHYYRLQGPSFLLEYDNSQNGANHIHTVWRDFDGDFGRDLLREHHAARRHD